jgi:threonine dehydratase
MYARPALNLVETLLKSHSEDRIMSLMFKAVRTVGLVLAMAGCASQQASQAQQAQRERQATLAAAVQQHNEDFAACRARFSEGAKDALARAKCFNKADERFVPTVRYSDLVALVVAK